MDGFECPYVVAMVDLRRACGSSRTSSARIPLDVEIGQGIDVTFEDVGDGVVLPQFRLN